MSGLDTFTEPLTDAPTPATPSNTGLLSGIFDDAQRLVRQQIDMVKTEFKEEVARTKRAGAFGGLVIVLATIGGLTLVAALVNYMHEHFQYSMWASCLIIGSFFVAVGVAFGLAAWRYFENFNPMPEKSIKALQENLTWKTQS